MLFMPELADKALAGTKTQTRRLQKPGDEAVRDETGRIVAVTRLDRRGRRRLLYMVHGSYAVQPGRGKKATGRITLTAIRDQKIQDISTDDAIAEGCPSERLHEIRYLKRPPVIFEAVSWFIDLWDDIHRRPAHRFDANPPVWALTIKAEKGN